MKKLRKECSSTPRWWGVGERAGGGFRTGMSLDVPAVNPAMMKFSAHGQAYLCPSWVMARPLPALPLPRHAPQVLLYLARALYDSNKLAEAQSCLKRAIHLAPTDYKLRFNFALTMQVRGAGWASGAAS